MQILSKNQGRGGGKEEQKCKSQGAFAFYIALESSLKKNLVLGFDLGHYYTTLSLTVLILREEPKIHQRKTGLKKEGSY